MRGELTESGMVKSVGRPYLNSDEIDSFLNFSFFILN